MLAWLSVWSELQTCIWPSWCHCHSLSLASVKSRLVLPFWYRLIWVVLDEGPLNECVCACVLKSQSLAISARQVAAKSTITKHVQKLAFFHITKPSAAQCSPSAYKPPPSEYTDPGPVSLGRYVDIRCSASFSWPCMSNQTHWLGCDFTSHSTQNRSFRRRFPKPISWLGIEKTKHNTTKACNHQSTTQNKHSNYSQV